MKREIIEFKDIVTDLYAISESPNFSDEMRNKASELQYYINKNVGNLEPIIKKSRGTFVARYDGVDYLYRGKSLNPSFNIKHIAPRDVSYWAPIGYVGMTQLLEITDELAKLRPSVTNIHSNENYTLLGVVQTSTSVYSEKFKKLSHIDTYVLRLSTVSDLEQQS
ncbi:hypothetical protein KAR91_57105 [Candidatus Pacearchaeota archaeon]|nr:hypothetical protein [Candidatus Pacearchaeota archaeon]